MPGSVFDLGPPPPCPERFNIAAWVTRHAAAEPERAALVVTRSAEGPAETWSLARADRAIRAVAAGLRAAGLRRGERVMLRLGNTPDFAMMFFGTIAAGGIAVPVSAQLTAPETRRLIGLVEPRFLAASTALAVPGARVALLHEAAIADLLASEPGPIADTAADDPAFAVFTSGTGGTPKAVLHAQRSAWARRMMWQGWYGLEPGDRVLHAGAFNWTYTLGAGLTDPWAAGATALIHAGPDGPDLWPRLAARHGATLFCAVPGVYRRLVRSGRDLAADFATLRHGLTAGEAMPPAVSAAWTERTGKPVYEALGMSEISTYLSASPAVPPRPGTSGRPQAGRRVAVIGEDGAPLPHGTPGLLAVSRRDPGLMLGYWRAPEQTGAAFRGEWFVTGDRAAMDPDGYVTWLGRADEVMTALGYRVGPVEVEAALAGHPALADVAVAELPVRPDLSLIAAFAVPRAGWPGDAALDAWAAGRLAAYKRPRIWIEVDAIPRTPNGKVIRRALVEAHRRDRGDRAPAGSGPAAP